MDKWSILGKLGRAISSFFPADAGTGTVLVVKTVYASDGKRRVRFFQREEDRVCSFLEEFFDDKILEMNWKSLDKEPAREYPDLAAALAAAKAAIPWLHLVLE
jgi:hypothetical protein